VEAINQNADAVLSRRANGHLARAVAQAILLHRGLIRGPVLPLGPILKINGAAHAGTLRAAEFQADWQPIFTLYAAAFARTAQAVAALSGAAAIAALQDARE